MDEWDEQDEDDLLEELMAEDVEDPSKAPFWEEALQDPEGLLLVETVQSLLQELEGIKSTPLMKKMSSKKMSMSKSKSVVGTSEKVLFKYEYHYDASHYQRYNWIQSMGKSDPSKPKQQGPKIAITGQFNDWTVEELQLEQPSDASQAPIDQENKLKYTYQKSVNGG